MDLNQLQSFQAVAKTLSFTGAARRLGVPQSTVSRHISDLEQQLGAKLFYRTKRDVQLTEEGRAFLPYTGEIRFERAGGRRTRPLVGYVPQSPAFDPGDPVSVLDLFASAIGRWPVFLPVPRALRERVAACLDRVHARELLDRRVGTLSGGELQRVLLAMALEPLPHILILDEPMSGVDIEGEHQLMDMLNEIRSSYDLSILLSTHDFATLEQYADKVVLLKQSVLKVGRARDVLASPEFRSVFHLTFERGNA